MGTGAVFGLTSALVGETLPGSGPAIATGNALAEGPVVFYWPQQIIDELEQNAELDGNNEWVQLRVDLFRQVPEPKHMLSFTANHARPFRWLAKAGMTKIKSCGTHSNQQDPFSISLWIEYD